MKKGIATLVLLLVIASLSRVPDIQHVLAATPVAPGESIQAAIDNASPGDTILIQSGTHHVADYLIIVNKAITLMGEDVETTIIDGGGKEQQIFNVIADSVRIHDLTIQNNSQAPTGAAGIQLYRVMNVEVTGCRIRNCYDGIRLTNSSDCNITRNELTDNYESGIYLQANISRNLIKGNTISDNPAGLWVAQSLSSDNMIYHNSFVDNTEQRGGAGTGGTWDNGYPSGGNYWSDHTNIDQFSGQYQNETGGDGMADQPYNAGPDEYPFAAGIHFFNAGRWDDTDYCVGIVANSTTSDFHFNPDKKQIGFNATGPDGTIGFCRVAIPKQLLWVEGDHQWTVSINHTAADPTILDQYSDFTYLYFVYSQSTEMIEIEGSHALPEFQTAGVLLFLALLLAIAIFKRAKASSGQSSSG